MVAAIFLTTLTISSLSVTTFAWYSGVASATANGSPTNALINLGRPDDYFFYGYNGNIDSSFSPNGTFSHDFTPLTTSELVNTYTGLDDMVPGDIFAFALGIKATESASLTLTKMISNNATKENIRDASSNIQERYVYGTANHKLNVGYAIDIFANAYTPANDAAPTGYVTFVQSPYGCKSNAVAGSALANGAVGVKGVKYFTRAASGAGAGPLNDGSYAYTYYKTGNGVWTADAGNKYFPLTSAAVDLFDFNIASSYDRADLDSGTYASQEITLSSKNKGNITFFNNASLATTNDLYIVWTVAYSDVADLHYGEVTSGGSALSEKPTTGNRWFQQDNAGTSNCFGGLTFALTEFELVIG